MFLGAEALVLLKEKQNELRSWEHAEPIGRKVTKYTLTRIVFDPYSNFWANPLPPNPRKGRNRHCKEPRCQFRNNYDELSQHKAVPNALLNAVPQCCVGRPAIDKGRHLQKTRHPYPIGEEMLRCV